MWINSLCICHVCRATLRLPSCSQLNTLSFTFSHTHTHTLILRGQIRACDQPTRLVFEEETEALGYGQNRQPPHRRPGGALSTEPSIHCTANTTNDLYLILRQTRLYSGTAHRPPSCFKTEETGAIIMKLGLGVRLWRVFVWLDLTRGSNKRHMLCFICFSTFAAFPPQLAQATDTDSWHQSATTTREYRSHLNIALPNNPKRFISAWFEPTAL